METRHPAGRTEGGGLSGMLALAASIAAAKTQEATGDTALAGMAAMGVGVVGELILTKIRDYFGKPILMALGIQRAPHRGARQGK